MSPTKPLTNSGRCAGALSSYGLGLGSAAEPGDLEERRTETEGGRWTNEAF